LNPHTQDTFPEALALESIFESVARLPELVVIEHYKIVPATPEEINYYYDLSIYYRLFVDLLKRDLFGVQANLFEALPHTFKGGVQTRSRLAKAIIKLGFALLGRNGDKIKSEIPYLPYILWLEFELTSLKEEIWRSELISGVAEKNRGKTRVTEEIKSLINLLREPHRNQRSQKKGRFRIADKIPENVPGIVLMISGEIEKSPDFYCCDEYQELLNAMASSNNWIRETPNHRLRGLGMRFS
jgi:hypothetical protein